MAINMFSIPAILSEPERVFLGAKYTLSKQRITGNIKIIELLKRLKPWFRLSIYTENNLH